MVLHVENPCCFKHMLLHVEIPCCFITMILSVTCRDTMLFREDDMPCYSKICRDFAAL